jgi:arsenite methyltransferase
VVVSSLVLHNIPGAGGRAAAIGEVVRVLKPGGRVAILDFRNTGQYAAATAQVGKAGLAFGQGGLDPQRAAKMAGSRS